MPTAARTEKLDLRLTLKAKRVLQSAATAAKRSVSEFVQFKQTECVVISVGTSTNN